MRKSKLYVGVATLVAATFVASAANAQDTTVSTGEIAVQPTVASFVAAIDATPATIEKLGTLESINSADITLVDVHSLVMSDSAAVKGAIERNAEQTEQLRTSISANAAISQALSAHTPPLSASDVVAAEVSALNKVVLFYKSKEGKDKAKDPMEPPK